MPRATPKVAPVEVSSSSPRVSSAETTYQSTVLVGVLLGIVLSYVNLVQFFIGVFVGCAISKESSLVNRSFIIPLFSSMCNRIHMLLSGIFRSS